MTFLLTTDVEIKHQDKFYWLFEELLISLGHDVILNKNAHYDIVIYYGNSLNTKMNSKDQNMSCPILIIPYLETFISEVVLRQTQFGEVIVHSRNNYEDLYITSGNNTKVNFDLNRFLFYYLAEEEYTNNTARDKFGRLTFSLSKKTNIELESPIVNMWASWIDKWLCHELEKRNELFYKKCIWPNRAEMAISFSHDVDIVNKSLYRYWKTFIYYLITQETSFKIFFISFFQNAYLKLVKRATHFTNYQFDRILRFHKENNIKATFNIISSNKGGLDNESYLKIAKDDLKKLIEEDHEIGLHGGYESKSYCNEEQLIEEKNLLEKVINNNVISTRQHYLGFEHDTTFLTHEKSGIQYDSTIAYPDKAGFKTSFAGPYQPWIFSKNRKANLYELPLILMDGTLLSKTYGNMGIDDAKNKFKYFFETVKRYNGVLTINWHQRIFSEGPYKNWMELYYFAVDYMSGYNVYKATQKEILNRYQKIKKIRFSTKNNILSITSPIEIDSFSFKFNKPFIIEKTDDSDLYQITERKEYIIIEIKRIKPNEIISFQLNNINS